MPCASHASACAVRTSSTSMEPPADTRTIMSRVTESSTDTPWLIGCGSADVTGEPWRVGMMGYGMRFQRSTGIQLRQRSRAFVLVDRDTERRLAYVVADIGMFFR